MNVYDHGQCIYECLHILLTWQSCSRHVSQSIYLKHGAISQN